ncbi:ABC transporter ATP-binding protein [Fulvivirgaceae bacterium BMA10]|uniref:ABC transporter ATP-binding protein n=1 Tax=Splendidivirga corallicola TaxID=3051826 RepID=A0ABT8KH33_9BACT|nr:ABC transporter ATP-binding protein [Fulvivirgaceae bacterium BMA10]
MAIIEVIDVKKVYNPDEIPVEALRGVNLQIEPGEFTAIVGPSGSGKSTLLNIIGGLDSPTRGKILIGGRDISEMKESQLIDFRLNNIGFVFQSYNLIPVLTAIENVAFIMELQNVSKKERNQRAMELLEEVGIAEQYNRRPSQLSGGQQQRVAVARALASRPKFILADEPTANLDSVSTSNLLDMMAEMNEKEKATFIFSTHDQRVIDKAKRIITLEDGIIVSDVVKSNLTHVSE